MQMYLKHPCLITQGENPHWLLSIKHANWVNYQSKEKNQLLQNYIDIFVA